MNEIKDKIEQITAHYTFSAQREVYIEECAEAIQATAKLDKMIDHNDLDLWEHFVEEVADNYIMVLQMAKYIGEKKFYEKVNEKLNRQLRRIREKVKE